MTTGEAGTIRRGASWTAAGARWLAAAVALIIIAAAVANLEAYRAGLSITQLEVGTTPATIYRRADAPPAPAVIITHGFAGSRQLMEAYALTLARAGYVAVAFDFEGHGRNPVPMSGDVTRVAGTTRVLMREIGRVTDAVLALPFVDGRVALLGHSMASDIIVRQSIDDPRIAAVVAISMFSKAVTADQPRNLLMVVGAWERFLRGQALAASRLVDGAASEGETVRLAGDGGVRRAVAAPAVEHIGVLYSATALTEARAFLDSVFGRTSNGPPAASGGWIVLLLVGIVLLAWPLAALLPKGTTPPAKLPLRTFLVAALVPAAATPLLLSLVDTRFLPVLVADYLAAHLLVFGLMSIVLAVRGGARIGRLAFLPGLALAAYGIFVFGGALDRYAASFMPHAGRLPIIAVMALGAVPYMLADSLLCEAGRAALWRVLVARGAFLASLGLAVALDVSRLFFLLIILPVIAVFFIVFGLLGGWAGRRTLSPLACGLGLGLILAWALGVSFPMFMPA